MARLATRRRRRILQKGKSRRTSSDANQMAAVHTKFDRTKEYPVKKKVDSVDPRRQQSESENAHSIQRGVGKMKQ